MNRRAIVCAKRPAGRHVGYERRIRLLRFAALNRFTAAGLAARYLIHRAIWTPAPAIP